MQAELVARAQQGDREAFSTLARDVSARLYATARLILREPDRAEDAVQDALIEAWRGIRGLRDPIVSMPGSIASSCEPATVTSAWSIGAGLMRPSCDSRTTSHSTAIAGGGAQGPAKPPSAPRTGQGPVVPASTARLQAGYGGDPPGRRADRAAPTCEASMQMYTRWSAVSIQATTCGRRTLLRRVRIAPGESHAIPVNIHSRFDRQSRVGHDVRLGRKVALDRGRVPRVAAGAPRR